MNEAWYGVYMKHQHEKTAADLLSRNGFETLLPLYETVHRWKDRRKVISLPLFPCYLFVRTGLERKLDILRTPGVFWFVGNNSQALPIDDREIHALQHIQKSQSRSEPYPYLREGDRVRVISGSLTGLTGLLIRTKNRHRLVVAVELLRKAVAVEVDYSAVEHLQVRGRPESQSTTMIPMLPSLRANEF